MSDAIKAKGTIIRRAMGGSPEQFEAIAEITSFDGPQMSAPDIDVSNFDSTMAENIIGLPDGGSVTLGCNYLGSGAQDRVRADFRAGAQRAYQIELVSGRIIQFTGGITAVGLSGASVNDKIAGSFTLRVSGVPSGI